MKEVRDGRNVAMAQRIEDSEVTYPCTGGEGRPEDRGALFHCVEFSISERGDISGRVIQAFAGAGVARIEF